MPSQRPPDAPPEDRLDRVEIGHTCLPYESGDVAWLGHRMNFSLFPGLTFEDRMGSRVERVGFAWERGKVVGR